MPPVAPASLSPIERAVIEYIAEQRAISANRGQARQKRIFSTTSNGALGAAPSTVRIDSPFAPEFWVIVLSATSNATVTITQSNTEGVDIIVPVQGRRIVLPGDGPGAFRLTITATVAVAGAVYTVAAISGYDPKDVL